MWLFLLRFGFGFEIVIYDGVSGWVWMLEVDEEESDVEVRE